MAVSSCQVKLALKTLQSDRDGVNRDINETFHETTH